MAQRQAHPIDSVDLDKKIPEAERYLKTVKGSKDLQVVFMEALEKRERYRILPEAESLLLAARKGLCFFFHFLELMQERTGQNKEVESLRQSGVRNVTTQILEMSKFANSYAIFVMASFIANYTDQALAGKNPATPKIDMQRKLTADSTPENNIKYLFSDYVDALLLRDDNSHPLVETVDDLLAVSRVFWKAVAEKAAVICKDLPELLECVRTTTFTCEKFTVSGLMSESREEKRIISFPLIKPEEVVGDEDVTIIMLRCCDRLALYDIERQDNPIRVFGGLIESMMLDGPPGTGKTRRMQMMMTRIKTLSDIIGYSFSSYSLTADQVKNEFYGKTAQLMKEFMSGVSNPLQLAMMLLDDFDLMVSSDRNNGGSDNDVMKGLMDFLAGSGTNYIGNYLVVGATNRSTSSDSALRQRMVYRANLLGPKSWQQYADVAALELAKFAKTGLLKVGESGDYKPLSRPLPKTLAESYDPSLLAKHKRAGTFSDIGHLCEELRAKDPEFTGRSVKNALQVAVAQAADFDIPMEWFEKPVEFRDEPWDRRVEMIRELYKPLSAPEIMMALENQFKVEARYRLETHEREVADAANRIKTQQEALGRIK